MDFLFLFDTVPDFGIDVLSTNGSLEAHGPGLLKVSGLERSQERSQESCRDTPPPASSTHIQPPPPKTLPLPHPSIPSLVSPRWTHANGPSQAPTSTRLPPRSEALNRPQTPAALPLAQGQEHSPPPPPRPQLDLLSHPQLPPTPSLHPHPPSPSLPTHHPHQQHPSQAGPHRPSSRCHLRPLPAYNSLNLNGHR